MRTPLGAAGGPFGAVPRGITNSVTLWGGSVAARAPPVTGTSARRVIAFAAVAMVFVLWGTVVYMNDGMPEDARILPWDW